MVQGVLSVPRRQFRAPPARPPWDLPEPLPLGPGGSDMVSLYFPLYLILSDAPILPLRVF